MANKKPQSQTQADLKEQLKDLRNDNETSILNDIYGQNSSVLAIFKEISKKIDRFEKIDSSINDNYKELLNAIKENNFSDVTKSVNRLVSSVEKNSKDISAKTLKKAKFESNNPEAGKNINNIKINASSKDIKTLKELKKIIDDITQSAINGSYSAKSMMENFDVISFNKLDEASDQLKVLNKEADNAGVSVSTLGLKFKSSGNNLNIFNKSAEDGYNKIKNLRDGFDKCGAKTFTFFASLAILDKGFKNVSGSLGKLMDETVLFRRNFQILSNSSKDILPGGAKQLNEIRSNMKLTREETVKFLQTAQELRGTTYTVDDLTKAMDGMKNTIGEVDIDKLKSLANVMKSIPKIQLDAFSSGVGKEDDVMNAIMNMQKSGNIQEVLNLGSSGAFGSNFAKASGTNISANDKAYVGMKKNINVAKEMIGEGATDFFGGIFKMLPAMGIASMGGDMFKKIYSGIGMYKGGTQALKDISSKDNKPATDTSVKDITKKSEDIKKAINTNHKVQNREITKLNSTDNAILNVTRSILTRMGKFGNNSNSNLDDPINRSIRRHNNKVNKNIKTRKTPKVGVKTGKISNIGNAVNTASKTKATMTGASAISSGMNVAKTGSLLKTLNTATKTVGMTLKGFSAGLKGFAASSAASVIGSPVAVAALALDAALSIAQGYMNIEADNLAAKGMQSELGISNGKTNAYSLGGMYDFLTGKDVSFDPKLYINSLDSFYQGMFESLSFGLYKESAERKEKRQLDTAARTQDKYTVDGFKEVYKINKRVNELKEINIRRNIYSAQHYDATIKRLDSINQGQFSMLETMRTQVGLLQMQSAFSMGKSNADFSNSSFSAINNSINGFLKEQSELDRLKNETISNSNLTETQRNAELLKISESEINIRTRMLDNLKKALSFDNLPSIIENNFIRMFNESIQKINSSGYMGSSQKIIDVMISDVNTSFEDLGASILEASKSLRKIKEAQQKFENTRSDRVNQLNVDLASDAKNKILGANLRDDMFQAGSDDGGDFTFYEMFGSKSAQFTLSKNDIEALSNLGVASQSDIENLRLGKGTSMQNGELNSSFLQSSKDAGMSNAIKLYKKAISDGDKTMADSYLKWINGFTNNLKKRNAFTAEQQTMLDDLNSKHNAYAGSIGAANLKDLYKTQAGVDFSRTTYTMKKSDYEDIASKDENFRKQLEVRGLLNKDGSIDETKMSEVSQEYNRRKVEVGRSATINKLEGTDFFRNAIKDWEKSTGRKYDSNNKEIVEQILNTANNNLTNQEVAGLSKAQQDSVYSAIEKAVSIGDQTSIDNLISNKENATKILDEALKNAKTDIDKENINKGKEALEKLTSGQQLDKTEMARLQSILKSSAETTKLLNSGLDSYTRSLLANENTLRDISSQSIRTLESQTQVMKQLSDKYTDFIGKLTSLEQVVQRSTNVRLKELQASKAKTDLTLTEWKGGNTGSASFEAFKKTNEAENAKIDVIDRTLSELSTGKLDQQIKDIISNSSTAMEEIISNIESGSLKTSNDQTIADNIRKMAQLASEGANVKDDEQQRKILEQMDQLERVSIDALKSKYLDSSGNLLDQSKKDEYQQQLNAIRQSRATTGMVVGSSGTLEGVKLSLQKQRNEAEIKLIGNLREQSEILKKTKESLIAFAKSAERYALDQRTALLKENLGSGDDIKNNVESSMDAIEKQFAESKRMQQDEMREVAKQLSKAEKEYSEDPNEENKSKLIQMQALYNTSVGKGSQIELERMEAAAKAMRAGLEAITNKFALATEAIDILRDRAENVAGTTEEWFKLENERLSLMSQEVQEMKNLIASEKFRNLSEAEQQKLRNDLARKQLNFEKEKIGAQRNVFEKQLGAIVGGLQQSGAFKGMSKAAVFGAGHGINEADMAVQNRSKKVIGYTDRLALANNFFGDNIPVDRMAPHGDIDAAAAAHEQITGQSDREYYNRKMGGMLDNVEISSTKAKEAMASINDRIQKAEQQFSAGTISREERDRRVSELNDAKDKIKVSEKVSKLGNDEVFKSILTYVIDIDELLKNGKIELTNGQQSFNQNGTGITTSSSTRTNTTNNQQAVKRSSTQEAKSDNASGERLIFKVGTSESDLTFNERVLQQIEAQRKSAERGLERVSELLTRRGLSHADKEKYLKIMNQYQKYLKQSSVSNSETVSQLRRQIKVAKELQEINKYEDIASNYDGSHSRKEIFDAIRKLSLLKGGMSSEAKIGYISKKELDIERDREDLITKNKKSNDYKNINARIEKNRKEADEMLSSLSGDDFMKAAIERAYRLKNKKEEIDKLSQGTDVDKAKARIMQTEYDRDNESFGKILTSKGVSRESVNNVITKKDRLAMVNKEIKEVTSSLSSIKQQSQGRGTEYSVGISKLEEENKALQSERDKYDAQLKKQEDAKNRDNKAREEINQEIKKRSAKADEKWQEAIGLSEESEQARAAWIQSKDMFGNYDPELEKEYRKKEQRAQLAHAQYNDLRKKINYLIKERSKIGANEVERKNIDKKYEVNQLTDAIQDLEQKIAWEKDPNKKKQYIEQKRKFSLKRDKLKYELETPLDKQIEDNRNEQKFVQSLIDENNSTISNYQSEIKALEKSISERNSQGHLTDSDKMLNDEEQRRIAELKKKSENAQRALSRNTQRMQGLKQTEQQLVSDQEIVSKSGSEKPDNIAKRKAEIERRIAENEEQQAQLRQNMKDSQALSPEEQAKQAALQQRLIALKQEKADIESIQDYGVTPVKSNPIVGATEDDTVQEPPSAMVSAYIDRRNKQNQAILNSPEALQAAALSGGNSNVHNAINTSGIDGNRAVDTFGNYQDNGNQSQGAQKIEVILKLDERVLAKQVVDIVNGSYNRSLQHSVNGGLASRPTSANT